MGETMRQVIAHEVGHGLGLPHNWIASSAFPVDSLRSPTFTERYGVATSIMEYARQNYVAQPGDGVTRFVRKIGPYDHYAINWGYRMIPEANTPEEEKPVLDEWIMERAGDPMYRYGPVGPNFSPEIQTEDLGDDPVKASGYGIANLKRVLPKLPEWTATAGEDYTDLGELYGELISRWNGYTGHVRTVVGGVLAEMKSTDQGGAIYQPVPGHRQRDALQFIVRHVFEDVGWLNHEEILNRIEASGALSRIQDIQARNLESLLEPARLVRMSEAALVDPDAYSLVTFFEDLKNGVWSELDRGTSVEAYRRSLQRSYLERLASLMADPEAGENGRIASGSGSRRDGVSVLRSDIRPIIRAQLTTLQAGVRRAAEDAPDTMTRYHLADIAARIEDILEG